jgi:hypothetical protein
VNASVVSALVGAAIGGLTSVLASWLTQRTQVRAEWLAQDRVRRQDLYKGFVEDATRCYVDALQHDETDIANLVNLAARISHMLRQMLTDGTLDIPGNFGDACRAEFESLRAQQF